MAKVIIRTEWLDRIADEPIEVQNEVCGAIFLYQSGREVAGLSEAGQRAFAYLRRFVDKEKERSEKLSQTRSEAASRRWQQAKAQDTEASEDTSAPAESIGENANKINKSTDANALKTMQMHKKQCKCIKNDANASDEREKGSLSSSSPSSPTPSLSILPPITLLKEKPSVCTRSRMCEGSGEADDEPLSLFSSVPKDELPEELPDLVRTLWNRECRSFSKIVALSPERKNKILVRAREIGAAYGTADVLTGFADIFRRMEASDFLRGASGRWKATFDWLVSNGTNWVKVSEGAYDNDRQLAQQRGASQGSVNAAWENITPLKL